MKLDRAELEEVREFIYLISTISVKDRKEVKMEVQNELGGKDKRE